MRAYFDAIEPFSTGDIEAGVKAFLQGAAPGHNPAFAPSAPMVGAEVRRQMTMRLDADARNRRPALPPPDVVRSAESRERVKALVEHATGKLGEARCTDDARRSPPKPMSERVRTMLEPDMSSEALALRLGFGVGNDDEENA